MSLPKKQLNVDPQDCGLPWHEETRSCVFDYSDVLEDTSKKLVKPKLCSTCRGNLDEANVRNSVKKACLDLIKRALHVSPLQALQSLFNNPIAAALLGGMIVTVSTNWLNEYVSTKDQFLLLCLGLLIMLRVNLKKSPLMKL